MRNVVGYRFLSVTAVFGRAQLSPRFGRKLTASLFAIVCCLLIGDLGKSFAQALPTIDLIEGTFDGKPLRSLTIEDVTGRLGSPSASVTLPELVGVRLYYHELGLAFIFRTEPRKRLFSMDLYLAQTWHSSSRMFFAPYLGTLVPSVNANSTVEQIVEELNRRSSPTGVSIRENHRRLGLQGRLLPVYVIDFKGKPGNVKYFNEKATRLLEQISATIPG